MEDFEDIEKFKHIIEYEINRLDNVINSYYSQIIPVNFYLYASILSVLIFLSQFINDINEKTERDNFIIILLLIITAFAFSFLVFLPVISVLLSKFLNKFKDKNLLIPVIKNVPYQDVLKPEIRDRELYRSKFFIPQMKILFLLHIFFGILILSPYYLNNITIIKWDKAFYWVAYFLITDIIIFIVVFIETESLYNILFDFKNLMSNMPVANLLKISIKRKLIILIVIFFVLIWLMLYPVFWFYLTLEFFRVNSNSFIKIFDKNLFLFVLIFFITLIAINSSTDLIGKNYRVEVLKLKQEKYREIRRQLYESKEADTHALWKEFILNAPW